jgi:pheromone shutdown-related protein TraB
MKKINNIYILGTSHVAEESVKQVKDNFEKINPGILALELDRNRLYGLQNNTKRAKNIDLIRQLGLYGFMFYVFGEFAQKKIGKILKISPGSEMLTAFEIGKKNNVKIALIDRDIQITLKRFSKNFRLRELIKIFFSFFKGSLKKEKIDLKKVPSERLIEIAISEIKDNFPSIYKVLIHERDIYMGKKLAALSILYPDEKILAVVGAGHVKGMASYIEKILNTN